jgi:hypothetical protein
MHICIEWKHEKWNSFAGSIKIEHVKKGQRREIISFGA